MGNVKGSLSREVKCCCVLSRKKDTCQRWALSPSKVAAVKRADSRFQGACAALGAPQGRLAGVCREVRQWLVATEQDSPQPADHTAQHIHVTITESHCPSCPVSPAQGESSRTRRQGSPEDTSSLHLSLCNSFK